MNRRVRVLGGAGTVWRLGDLVAWFSPTTPPEFAQAVVGGLADMGANVSARHLVQVARHALDVSSSGRAAFALTALNPIGAAAVLYGSVVVSDEDVQRLNGERSDDLVDTDLVADQSITVRGSADPDPVHRAGCLPFDLVEGVVPGGGFVLAAPTRSAEPPRAPTEMPEGVVIFDLHEGPPPSAPAVPVHAEEPSPPVSVDEELPAAADGAETPGDRPVLPSVEFVRGIRCARDHFNHPEALYCRICGLAMVQKSVVATEGPRPSLGVLILDDGSTFSLDADYVIGRSPEAAEAVASGSARPLVVDDGTGQISRAHAAVRLHGWEVHVVDLGSRNGTHLLNPGDASWTLLSEGAPAVLQAGGRIAVGQRKIEFQTLQRR